MISTDLNLAEKLLRNNELVAIPTETVYGLAGNALSEEAVAQIFAVKNRPTFDPLIVHSDSLAKIKNFVLEFPPKALLLAEKFWAGSLTLLLPKKPIIPDLVTAGLPTVAVRIPKHFLTLQLLQRLEFPLAAPSANPFGYISPTTAQHVAEQLGEKIPLILDGGSCSVGVESTIVGFEGEKTIIYRLGGVSVEAIENLIGKVEVKTHSTSNPLAPGSLESHYAPTKKLFLGNLQEILERYSPQDIGTLVFRKPIPNIYPENQLILSEQGSFTEAAKNLFAMLRKLDKMPVKVIWAELLPEKDLGRAINDRLRRASAKR
ncbi:L-threonylcarbamoyladenylate synthase [Raineya orbicola]|jgi:L-threonylcarbamoyladenylate synthase|uniref:Threonylcarbamoyl-AMP synthase n=1 Tax=Raineya orbicola TaxID=2016530 RepID=A0A2N3IK13_9BACT|nr:L-threonylcarbamoyladenylate synthase [Raineya orbicola]PKQ70647.1 tRNA threonylcarbamoyl adenosine modification protein, Sua5/YciO/YrdC/YwlC family [Raineya orbicola]